MNNEKHSGVIRVKKLLLTEVKITSEEVFEWISQCNSPCDKLALTLHCVRNLTDEELQMLSNEIPESWGPEVSDRLARLAEYVQNSLTRSAAAEQADDWQWPEYCTARWAMKDTHGRHFLSRGSAPQLDKTGWRCSGGAVPADHFVHFPAIPGDWRGSLRENPQWDALTRKDN